MGLSSAFNAAVSGLGVAGRRADVISNNIANALTEGYARRDVELTTRSTGGMTSGVSAGKVTRSVDPFLQAELRLAGSGTAAAKVITGFRTGLEEVLGGRSGEDGLTDRISALESALTAAAARPDSTARLETAATALGAVTDGLNAAADWVTDARQAADSDIASQVATVNDLLSRVQQYNSRILSRQSSGTDVTALEQQRDLLVDRLSEIVPVRAVMRDNNQIALHTERGAVLLEGRIMQLGFTATAAITGDMTLANGDLSGLTLNGQPVSTGEMGMLSGGSLSASFRLRDELAPEASAGLDALARDLISRFGDPVVDPSLVGGQAGLFTDDGMALDISAETGLAGRISVNAAIDPDQGGDLWRLRAGLAVTGPGDTGDSTLLTALAAALAAQQTTQSGGLLPAERSASGLAADLLSSVSAARLQAEDDQAFAAARESTISIAVAGMGVDSDAELQDLLQLEQYFAANAQVLAALDEMLTQLISI